MKLLDCAHGRGRCLRVLMPVSEMLRSHRRHSLSLPLPGLMP